VEQPKTIHVFAPGVPLKELGVSLEDANWNTSVVRISVWVSRIKTVRVVTMRRVIVIRAATIGGPLMKLVEVVR